MTERGDGIVVTKRTKFARLVYSTLIRALLWNITTLCSTGFYNWMGLYQSISGKTSDVENPRWCPHQSGTEMVTVSPTWPAPTWTTGEVQTIPTSRWKIEIATQIGSTDTAGTESGTVVLAVQERIESVISCLKYLCYHIKDYYS